MDARSETIWQCKAKGTLKCSPGAHGRHQLSVSRRKWALLIRGGAYNASSTSAAFSFSRILHTFFSQYWVAWLLDGQYARASSPLEKTEPVIHHPWKPLSSSLLSLSLSSWISFFSTKLCFVEAACRGTLLFFRMKDVEHKTVYVKRGSTRRHCLHACYWQQYVVMKLKVNFLTAKSRQNEATSES